MNVNSGILLIFGICVFGGILSAVLVKRLSIPQVLGYILAGIIIGESGLRFVTLDDLEKLHSFNYFALGIIGFLVGGEIKFSTLRKYGKQFSAILISEGVLAFLIVGGAITAIMWHITGVFSTSLATGIVFGAIASATDPASTMDVLWEYRTAGIFTTTLIAIVALDDALAMTLYGFGTSIAQFLSGSSVEIHQVLMTLGLELGGSVILGIAAGVLLNFILHRSFHREHVLASAISILLLSIWIAVTMNMDIILVTMSTGITVINLSPKRSQQLFDLMRSVATPLYVLFFVLVGARLGFTNMPGWLWLIVVLYVVGRTAGKIAGAYIGARFSSAAPVVRRYLGVGLFAQGGVAIGLSIMASQHLNNVVIHDGLYLADVIIFGITTTTFIIQLIGPTMVKLAAKWAGELHKNITEEDVIGKWKVKDVVQTAVTSLREQTLLREVFITFSQNDRTFFPVIDDKKQVIGMVTISELKDVILDQSCWDWLLVSDVMIPVRDFVFVEQPLKEALIMMEQLNTDQLPVLTDTTHKEFAGIADRKRITHMVNHEILSLGTG